MAYDIAKIPWMLTVKDGGEIKYPMLVQQKTASGMRDVVAVKHWDGISLTDTSPLYAAFAHDDPRNGYRVNGEVTYVTRLWDVSGNGRHWDFADSTEQPVATPTGISFDGATQWGSVTLETYLDNIQSNDVGGRDIVKAIYHIETVEAPILGPEMVSGGSVTLNGSDVYAVEKGGITEYVGGADMQAHTSFVFTVQVTADSLDFALPLISTGTYDFNVDWGDGSNNDITAYNQAEVTHIYDTAGEYEIKISGVLKDFNFYYSSTAKSKMHNISNWGCLEITLGFRNFMDCINLTCTANDVLNLSNCTRLFEVFKSTSFNGSVEEWDVSNVTADMSALFRGTPFNQDISGWDVSSVIGMKAMFKEASLFNQDLSDWDVSSVISMDTMFYTASSFNQDLSPWDISNVTSMNYMFCNSGLSSENYGKILIGWAAQDVQPDVPFGAGTIKYPASAAAARQILIGKGWTITDGGQV